MIRVKNKKAIRILADRSFFAARTRNFIAIIAIALTGLLFTSLFTMGFGMIESMQRVTMVMTGGDGHASIKYVTDEEYEAISKHPLIKEMAYCRILSDGIDNAELIKRYTEFWYYDDLGLEYGFVHLAAGHRPQKENEVIADTKTLELLGVPLEIGAPLSLQLNIHGNQVKRDFVLSGWWESNLGFNVGQIFASRAYVDAHLNELQNTYSQNYKSAGTITGYIKFASSLNIEENLNTVLTESSFTMEAGTPNYIKTGINWAYMSTDMELEMGTVVAFACALLLFVFTGYLVIYNIFQISVLRDIRFYGLLKTIGTTGRQLRTIIRRQAFILALIGIPLGLFAGFFAGKALVPALMAQTIYAGSQVSVSPNPLIFVGAAAFALITVFISTNKPGKIAAKVSPVEAVGYTDNDPHLGKKTKKSQKGGSPRRMALANLGRNKRRTILVILSLTLSIVLTNTVFTLSQSVNVNKALEKFSDSDFLIGHADLFNLKYYGAVESALSEGFITAVKEQEGFEVGGRLYGGSWGSYTSENSQQTANKQPDGSLITDVYGLEAFPFSRLKLVDGERNESKLATGNYILEGVQTDDHGNTRSSNHQVGDKITLTIGDTVREMTVLGHVLINPSTNTNGSWIGSTFFLPADVYKKFAVDSHAMSYAFNVADDREAMMETFLKEYTSSVEPIMNYESKFTALAGLKGLQNTAVLVGGALALIIGIIGVLNFVNAVLTSILTRHREFAMLQSIGMTRKQLITMLCSEGIYYAALTGLSAILLSLGSSLLIVRPLTGQIWFMGYQFVVWPLVLILPLLFVLGALIPYVFYKATDKQSIVERLRIAG